MRWMGALCLALVLAAVWGIWWIVTGPPWAPMGDYGRCLKSHLVQVPYSTAGAKGTVAIAYRWESHCDQHEFPKGDGPAYQAALPDYQRRLAEYRRTHPDRE